MSSLPSRFPSARRLQWSAPFDGDQPAPSADDLAQFIAPYLDWELLEMDSDSTDILIGEAQPAPQEALSRELLILGGEIAQAWLRNVRKPAP